jgi:hypothetical protein
MSRSLLQFIGRTGLGIVLGIFGSLEAASAALLHFSYTQDDASNGSGTIAGEVNGIMFSGSLPEAQVSQVDFDELPVPAGMVGYLSGTAEPSPGNPFGVHLGWSGTITLSGQKQVGSESELYELDVPLVIPMDGAPGGGWFFGADLTDEDGIGNDSFGTGFRLAAWIGPPASGQRQSDDLFRELVQGEIDNYRAESAFDQVEADGQGQDLAMAVSYRNGSFGFGSGPMYVDRIDFEGSLFIDETTNPERPVGTFLSADFDMDGDVDLVDFNILKGHFGASDAMKSDGDANGDMTVNLIDFNILKSSFGQTSGVTASVPEPSTWALAVLGVGLCGSLLRSSRTKSGGLPPART